MMNHKQVKEWSKQAKPGDKVETDRVTTGYNSIPKIIKVVTKL